MHSKKIIKEHDGVAFIKSDLYDLPRVEVKFRQYSDGSIKGEIKNSNCAVELWDLLEKFTPITIEGNTSSGDSFVFHSYVTGLGSNREYPTELSGTDFEVTKTVLLEDHQEYNFKIEFGLLQLALFSQIKYESPFGEFIISPVQNSKEILEEIKESKIYDVTCHISFSFTSNKEKLEKNITEIVDYLESVMLLLSFAQGVFINFVYYNLYIKHAEGFKLYKSVHNTAKTKSATLHELIWTPHIQNFLESVLPTFTEDFQKQTGVGDAIEWYLESIRPSIVESGFIHGCIAIELLNDRFKENKSKGKILTKRQFKKIFEEVKNVISKHISDKGKREEMHLKLPELNRPTLKSSLRNMYDSYDIGYSDLFPNFEFVKIRDQIVHSGLSKGEFKDLLENYEKLVALLQRTLLGMLNYTGEFIDQLDNWKHKKFKKKID
ncbi:hypothetical protein B6U67_06075 [Methanosarcinales archaeon ex4484_138]|nr:MAG: hypothetical protein B6U67_06075 [Methanosarcinales archaeon ex4484_138]